MHTSSGSFFKAATMSVERPSASCSLIPLYSLFAANARTRIASFLDAALIMACGSASSSSLRAGTGLAFSGRGITLRSPWDFGKASDGTSPLERAAAMCPGSKPAPTCNPSTGKRGKPRTREPEIPEPADIGTKHTLPGTPRGVKAWRCCQGFVKTAVWTFCDGAQDHDAEAAAVIGGSGKNCVPTCGEQGADRQSVGRHGGVHCCWRDRGGHGMCLLVAIRLAGFCSDEVIGTGSLVCSTCPKTAAVSESTTPPGPDP